MEKKNSLSLFVSMALLGILPLESHAFEFSKNGVTGNFDTTLSWGAAWRVENRDPALVGIANGGTSGSVNNDDGNLNYDKGLISNALKVTHDLDLNYKNYGAFIRGSYFYDFHNQRKDSLSQEAKDRVGKDAELLDAYLRGSFTPGGKALDVRIGRQVVSWGESTFIQNSINVLNPVDVSRLRIPGAELREALLPVPMLWVSREISNNVTLEAVALTRFDHTRIDPRGTYFSTNDFASEGGQFVVTGFGAVDDDSCPSAACVPRGDDREAKDSGQYGLALRVLAPALNDTEFGLYFMNYHSRLPIVSANAVTTILAGPTPVPSSAKYFVEYPEDIHLIGISFNTVLGKSGIALQGEYSHRTNVPVQIEDVELLLSALCSPSSQLGACPAGLGGEVSGYRRLKIGQFQMTATKAFGADNLFKANQIILVGEVGVTHVYNMPSKDTLRFEGPGTPLVYALQQTGYADATSWGYRIVTRLDYNSVLGAVNLSPRLAFAHDVNGTSPSPGANFIEGRRAITLGLGASYLSRWSGDLSYTRYFGAGNFNQIHDRDFVSLNIKYSF